MAIRIEYRVPALISGASAMLGGYGQGRRQTAQQEAQMEFAQQQQAAQMWNTALTQGLRPLTQIPTYAAMRGIDQNFRDIQQYGVPTSQLPAAAEAAVHQRLGPEADISRQDYAQEIYQAAENPRQYLAARQQRMATMDDIYENVSARVQDQIPAMRTQAMMLPGAEQAAVIKQLDRAEALAQGEQPASAALPALRQIMGDVGRKLQETELSPDKVKKHWDQKFSMSRAYDKHSGQWFTVGRSGNLEPMRPSDTPAANYVRDFEDSFMRGMGRPPTLFEKRKAMREYFQLKAADNAGSTPNILMQNAPQGPTLSEMPEEQQAALWDQAGFSGGTTPPADMTYTPRERPAQQTPQGLPAELTAAIQEVRQIQQEYADNPPAEAQRRLAELRALINGIRNR